MASANNVESREVESGPRTIPHASTREWRPADRRELTILAVYFGLVVIVTDALNVRLGVELLTAIVAVAAVTITRAARLFLVDWWFLLVGMVMWNLSGPIAAGSPFPLHLDFMLNIDRFLFFGHDPAAALQNSLAVQGHFGPLDIAAAAGYNLHLAEPYIAAFMLWRINRLVYFQFAAAALILLVVGFVTFILFPAVPPWMASIRYGRLPGVYNGFGDVLRAHPLPFHGTPLFQIFRFRGDAVAALPSEHAAFPVLELIAFVAAVGRKGWFLALWVAFVCFSVLYLGEHWVTDILAGWIYAVVIFGVVYLLSRDRR